MNPHKVPFVGRFSKSMATLRREDGRGLLYHMDYTADYYKLLPALNIAVNAGCSTFVTKNMKGEPVMGRNFDLRHFRDNVETAPTDMTGLIVAVHTDNPRAKYRSVSFADAFWLDAKGGSFYEGVLDDGKKDISMALLLPFLCMDGVNEKGLAVSIMHLPTENRWDETEYVDYESLTDIQKRSAQLLTEPGQLPDRLFYKAKSGSYAINTADKKAWKAYKDFAVWQKDKGKKTAFHPILMRMMLDGCETVEEAIRLARTVNIKSPARDSDYHVLVADAGGSSVMLEWVNNELKIAPAFHGANFYLCREDRYGYGFERDAVMSASMAKYANGMPEQTVMRTLAVAAQDCRDDSDVGFTQWSAVYNLAQHSVKLCIHMDYDTVYEYSV